MFLSSASGNMIVMSISVGGDDFIAEQSDFEVLMVKIQVAFRRTLLRDHNLKNKLRISSFKRAKFFARFFSLYWLTKF